MPASAVPPMGAAIRGAIGRTAGMIVRFGHLPRPQETLLNQSHLQHRHQNIPFPNQHPPPRTRTVTTELGRSGRSSTPSPSDVRRQLLQLLQAQRDRPPATASKSSASRISDADEPRRVDRTSRLEGVDMLDGGYVITRMTSTSARQGKHDAQPGDIVVINTGWGKLPPARTMCATKEFARHRHRRRAMLFCRIR